MTRTVAKLAAGILLILLLLIMLTGYLAEGELLSHLPALAVVGVMMAGAVKMTAAAWREMRKPKENSEYEYKLQPKTREANPTTWEQDEPEVVCCCCGAEGTPDRYGCCEYCGSPIDE